MDDQVNQEGSKISSTKAIENVPKQTENQQEKPQTLKDKLTERMQRFVARVKGLIPQKPREALGEVAEITTFGNEKVVGPIEGRGTPSQEGYQTSEEQDSTSDKGVESEESSFAEEVLESLQKGQLLKLNTRSGVGEILKLGMNISRPSENDIKLIFELYGQEACEKVTFVVYAEGDGTLFEKGQLGLVGHRDILVTKTLEGELVAHTDYRTNDYDPRGDMDKKRVDRESLAARFLNIRGGSNSLERVELDSARTNNLTDLMGQRGLGVEAGKIKEAFSNKGDPYKKGLGGVMQASAVAYLVQNGISKIQRNIHLSEPANKLWSEYGVEVDEDNRGTLDTQKSKLLSERILQTAMQK